MSIDHIAHQLSCGECQEAINTGASQRHPGQCALNLDDTGTACPHLAAPGGEFCTVHGRAVFQTRARMDELQEAINQADRSIAESREKLREIDDLFAQARAQGWSQAKLLPYKRNRQQLVAYQDQVLTIKKQAAAELAEMA